VKVDDEYLHEVDVSVVEPGGTPSVRTGGWCKPPLLSQNHGYLAFIFRLEERAPPF